MNCTEKTLSMPNLPPPAVSVIVPLFNYEMYVTEAIASVQSQTLSNFECIIVNDGSTDDSEQVALKAIENDARFRLITIPNGGVANARNTGILQAQSQFVCCVDSDDRIEPLFLETCVSALEQDTGLGIAYTGLRPMKDGVISPNVAGFPPDEWNFDLQLQRQNQCPTCSVFRKEAWRRAGGYRKEVQPAEDANLWTRIGAIGYRAKKVTTEGLFLYRFHNNSLSTPIRTGEKKEPNWVNFPYVNDHRHPFASQATPNFWSHPVRNYDKPVVSVIIPVGTGHEHILYRSLDSIEYQTLREWEVIVVNDTGDRLPLIGYEWIREVQSDKRNASVSRNVGLQNARSPLVTFLDADDYFLPTYLEKMVSAYRRAKGRYVYCDWTSINKDGVEEIHATPEFSPEQMFRAKSMHSINVVMRRSDALKYPFDETMSTWEDVDFFMNLVSHNVCGQRVPEPLVVYDYNTGKLREKGETVKEDLIKLLYNRYQGFIEGTDVCSCGGSTGTSGTLQQSELAASLAQAGDMVLVEYHGATAGHTVVGSATNQHYGFRRNGDQFYVLKQDVLDNPEAFVPINQVENEIVETVDPPDPELELV